MHFSDTLDDIWSQLLEVLATSCHQVEWWPVSLWHHLPFFSSHLLSTHYLAQKCTGVVFVFVFDRLQFIQLCANKWPLTQKKFGRISLCWCQYCQALTATRVKKLNMVQNIPNQFGQKYNLKVIMRTLPIYIYIYMYVVMIKSMPNIMFQNMAMCSGTGLEGCHPLW